MAHHWQVARPSKVSINNVFVEHPLADQSPMITLKKCHYITYSHPVANLLNVVHVRERYLSVRFQSPTACELNQGTWSAIYWACHNLVVQEVRAAYVAAL